MERPSSPVLPIKYSRVAEYDPTAPTIKNDNARSKVQVARSQQSRETLKSTSAAPTRPPRFIWWLEILCAILLVGALVGIVATVNAFNDKPLPHWPYALSINSFIAAYSVLLKVTSGFILAEGISHIKWTRLKESHSLRSFWIHDEASRGPWGALHLLWNDKGRHIASLGAFITVLILFVDPFSQQIVSFPDCVRLDESKSGTIPRTNFYMFEGGQFNMGGSVTIPWGVRKAVNEGVFATTKPQVEFSCDTGNCTFSGTYSSVAFCSVCEDVTDKLIEVPWPVPKNISPSNVPEFARYPKVILPGSTTPSSPSANLTLEIVTPVGSVEENRRSMIVRGDPTIDVIRALDTRTYVARSCKMDACVRTYEAHVEKGILKEELKSEHMMPRNFMFGFYRVADLSCLDNDKKAQLREMGYDLNANPDWIPYNVTVDYNATLERNTYRGTCQYMPADQTDKYCDKSTAVGSEGFLLTEAAASIVPAECVYSMADAAGGAYLAKNLFRDMFNGTMEEFGTFSTPALFPDNEPVMAIYQAGSGNGTLQDISDLMKNVSDALTTHVRQHGTINMSEPMLGTVQHNTVCIRVQWEWVIYSASIVGLTLVFLVWVILQAKSDQAQLRRAWERQGVHAPFYDFKSSALTLLFHGLDDDSRRQLMDVGSHNRTSEMEKLSQRVNVQMVATERGWKIAAVK
ncbi:hypothetical protein ACN47E_006532 [Coniothyrium glycines]